MELDKNLIGGSTRLLLLSLLSESDRYGYDIIRTLAERILDECGGGELPTVSEAGRAVLVRRALHALDPEDISQFGGVRRSASFCAACAKAVQ